MYNAAVDLIGRNLAAGRANKPAFIDITGSWTYGQLDALTNRWANALRTLGIRPEQRLVMVMDDTIDFPVCFLGAIKAGVVPVPVNTRLTAADYAYIMEDSRAAGLVVSDTLLDTVVGAGEMPEYLTSIVVSGKNGGPHSLMSDLLAAAPETADIYPTGPDDMCFWLYSSGTTGRPKGVVHCHDHLIKTADLYAIGVLGIREDDVAFSAAKLFFAYGLGNGLTFPMSVGATAILHSGPPDPASVGTILRDGKPTLFFGVPTLFGMLLASPQLPGADEHTLRLCVSAGEALPEELFSRWQERMGVDILDGLGSTEMLHIFLSNKPGEIVPGSTGYPVPGYELRLVDDEGAPAPAGEMGMLEVSGPTSALLYWNQRARTKATFRGPWTQTGDKYQVDENGAYRYCGRADDMMKVGGIYVSPFEVEGALLKHPAVLESAVVGHPDQDGLIKPKAFVVLNEGETASDEMAESLRSFVKNDLASFKYPRWIAFLDSLPKTATGKIQRFKLREAAGP